MNYPEECSVSFNAFVIKIKKIDYILIVYFSSYLTIWLLCLFRICRRWRRIASDRSLWKHVNLTAYELNLKKMWKIIRNHFSEVLLSLHLKGHLAQGM